MTTNDAPQEQALDPSELNKNLAKKIVEIPEQNKPDSIELDENKGLPIIEVGLPMPPVKQPKPKSNVPLTSIEDQIQTVIKRPLEGIL